MKTWYLPYCQAAFAYVDQLCINRCHGNSAFLYISVSCKAVIGTNRLCFVTSITVAFVLVDDNTESILTNIACSSASCIHIVACVHW